MSKVQISNLSGVDLNEITTDGHYRLSGGCTNVPITGGGWEQWTQLLVITGAYSDNTTQIMPIYWDGTIWVRTIKAPGTWTEWSRLATATKPQEFDLPLAEGVTALQPCTYWKNQFGDVTIGGCAANGISDNITIATLPTGFRPAKAVERPATLSGGGERYAGSVLIGTDGAIRIRTPATTNAVVFGATFIAAG